MERRDRFPDGIALVGQISSANEISPADKEIISMLAHPIKSDILFHRSPILWIRAAIGLRSFRGASQVTDKDLYESFLKEGSREWDRHIYSAVASYLRSKGPNRVRR